MRALAEGAPACVTVTVVRGLVLARSAFEHSANYESVVALGRFRLIEDADAKLAALEAVIDRLVPGRWREVRPPNAKELRATLVLSMPLDEASAKVRSGPPDDDGSPDADLDVWAGVVPIETSFGAPLASPGLRPEIALAASVAGLQPAGPTELSGCGPSPAPSAPRRS
jgi:hypothetical protein